MRLTDWHCSPLPSARPATEPAGTTFFHSLCRQSGGRNEASQIHAA